MSPNFMAAHPFDRGNFFGRDERPLPWPRTKRLVAQNLALYYAVVTYLDTYVGRILGTFEETALASSTSVIFTNDTGLAPRCHGLMGKQNMYEHKINVPLIISGPDIAWNVRSSSQCYLRDLYPTICQLAGLPVPAQLQAKSLLPACAKPDAELYPFVIGYYHKFHAMIRASRWKLIRHPYLYMRGLFNAADDRYETNDLASNKQFQYVAARLQSRILEWFRDHGDALLGLEKCGR